MCLGLFGTPLGPIGPYNLFMFSIFINSTTRQIEILPSMNIQKKVERWKYLTKTKEIQVVIKPLSDA